MQENVGQIDRALRVFTGAALVTLGLTALGGRRGRTLGLLTALAGVLSLESGITRVCPTNFVLGIDTGELEQELLSRADAS